MSMRTSPRELRPCVTTPRLEKWGIGCPPKKRKNHSSQRAATSKVSRRRDEGSRLDARACLFELALGRETLASRAKSRQVILIDQRPTDAPSSSNPSRAPRRRTDV